MADRQAPVESLDLSFILRTVMAARKLTVTDLAEMGGVSKSAMEKYLAGPSSPRAITIASLSRALGISADVLMFGAIDSDLEVAFQLVMRRVHQLVHDLRDGPMAEELMRLAPASPELDRFVWNLAYDQAGQFKRELNALRLASRVSQESISTL